MQDLRVFTCRLGSQHNLTVESVRRRGLCGAWELSSLRIGRCTVSSPLWSPLPLRGLQAEAGRWKTERPDNCANTLGWGLYKSTSKQRAARREWLIVLIVTTTQRA